MTTTIRDLMPRNTVGTIPVSEEYLNEFADRIIMECVRVADERQWDENIGDAIIENFGLR